jgi:AcrR family transcriptional regulator
VQQIATPECDTDTDAATELTAAQIVALAAIAGGGSVSDAAAAAGMHRATIYRWLDDDAGFLAELNRLQHEARARLAAQVAELHVVALQTVRNILEGTEAPAAVRLRAALAVLGRAGVLEPEPEPGPVNADDIRASWGARATVRKLYRD